MDVGEGQKQVRCRDSPVRRRDGVMSNVAIMGLLFLCIDEINAPLPLLLTEPDRSDPPPHSECANKGGVPASPWMWAKARSKLGAVIRLCGDGVMSNV
jgi:hypothetical protein